jgi:hypothetical protein
VVFGVGLMVLGALTLANVLVPARTWRRVVAALAVWGWGVYRWRTVIQLALVGVVSVTPTTSTFDY